jgi:hypothetical protein
MFAGEGKKRGVARMGLTNQAVAASNILNLAAGTIPTSLSFGLESCEWSDPSTASQGLVSSMLD